MTKAGAAAMSRRDRLLVFGGLMLASLMSSLDATILGTALPTIVGELGGLERIAWVSTAYVLATSVTMPLSGKLGDLYGRRPVFVAGLLAFLTGSAACGAAPSMDWLIAFRAVQGAGAGALMASNFGLAADLFEPRERARYQGYAAINFAVSSLAGPLIGGFFTEHLSWRWVFYVNIPLGAIALVTALVFLRLPRPEGRPPRVDYPGILLLGGAVVCFTLLTSWAGTRYGWTDPVILGLAAGTAALLALWTAAERRAAEPVIPLSLFRNRSYAVACAVALAGGAIGFALATYLPMFFQTVGGVGATDSGLLLLPMMLGLLAASMGAGRYIHATGRYHRLPAASMAVGAAAIVLLATMTAGTGPVTAGLFMAVLGFGTGLSQQVVMLVAQQAAPKRDMGAAGSGVFAARMVGTAAGMAVFGGVLSSRFATEIAARVPAGTVPAYDDVVRPEFLSTLPDPVRDDVAQASAEAFQVLFLTALPVALAGLAAALLLRNVPLTSPPGGRGGPGR
ncbi:MDR family MFS transporter [Spirillospora sp. NPDC029432]|uniref:MDR family MFS transporter n=1 Tax=Spirillospora sp. NPDC029432 TaxID=3154599 RepID=UPI003454939B